jgi:hypothetical protein
VCKNLHVAHPEVGINISLSDEGDTIEFSGLLSLNCKNVQIYLPCNFEVNLITHFGVIALFSSNFQNFNTFHPFLKNY